MNYSALNANDYSALNYYNGGVLINATWIGQGVCVETGACSRWQHVQPMTAEDVFDHDECLVTIIDD